MKIELRLLLVLCLLCLWLAQAGAQGIVRVPQFGQNPGNLRMYSYAPADLGPNEKAPLVVVLHGCLQSAKVVAKQTGWNQLADKYRFRVLYPQQRVVNNGGKCFCWFNNKDIEKNKGEVFSIAQMVEQMQASNAVDSSAIFVTGLSAGAAMGVALLADYPQKFKAGAIFAGGPYKVATNIWTASLAMYGWRIKSPEKWGELVKAQNPGYKGNYPNLMVYHGKADVVVNRRNATELVKQWANLTGASPTATEIIARFANNKRVEKRLYQTPDGRNPVVYYRIKRMGHALPIDPGKCDYQGGKRLPFSADKNFYSTFWAAYDFGLINLPAIEGKKEVLKKESGLIYSAPHAEDVVIEWQVPDDCKIEQHLPDGSIKVSWGNKPGNVVATGKPRNAGCNVIYPVMHVTVK